MDKNETFQSICEKEGLTENSKFQLNIKFIIVIVASLALWIMDWSLFALFVYFLAVAYGIDLYKIEVVHDNRANKKYIKKWLQNFFNIALVAAFILFISKSPYSALFVFGVVFMFGIEVAKLEAYDKEQNGIIE